MAIANDPQVNDDISPSVTEEPGETADEKVDKVKRKCLQYIEKCISNMVALQSLREEALKAYQREKYGNEIRGRSQVIMSDVFDTVESIMPSLMRIFYGGQDVVNLNPVGPEDMLPSKLMESKINFDFQRRLNGFQILYDFFKDALILKSGVVKWYWKEDYDIEVMEFENLTEPEIAVITESPSIEVVSREEDTPEGSEITTYKVKAHRKTDISGPCVENLRSDEFLFLPNTRSVKDADFICHRKAVKRAYAMAKYGITELKIEDSFTQPTDDPVYMQMWVDLGGIDFISPDRESDEVWLYECYLNEYDNDGNRIPKIATIICNELVQYDDNPYGRPPFAVASPIRQPHRMVGGSIAELVLDIQKLRTAIMRYVMDNIYFQNNGVNIINPYRIDASMLQSNNVPGGLVFTTGDWEPGSHIFPVPIKPLAPWIMEIMEYVEGPVKENRTGVTKYNQGLDSKSLNRTASGISQIMSAAQQRMELIARIFAEAEDGVKAIFQALVDMNLKFFNRNVSVRLNGQWQDINPANIHGKFDIVIDVGGGTGTKEMKVNQLMQMLDKYGNIVTAMPQIISPQNVYNLLESIWENMGFKNAQQYLTSPGPAGQMSVMQLQMLLQQTQPQMQPGGQAPPTRPMGPQAPQGPPMPKPGGGI
jgi:hypothetical protein